VPSPPGGDFLPISGAAPRRFRIQTTDSRSPLVGQAADLPLRLGRRLGELGLDEARRGIRKILEQWIDWKLSQQ
jgi:hypothetical protein